MNGDFYFNDRKTKKQFHNHVYISINCLLINSNDYFLISNGKMISSSLKQFTETISHSLAIVYIVKGQFYLLKI